MKVSFHFDRRRLTTYVDNIKSWLGYVSPVLAYLLWTAVPAATLILWVIEQGKADATVRIPAATLFDISIFCGFLAGYVFVTFLAALFAHERASEWDGDIIIVHKALVPHIQTFLRELIAFQTPLAVPIFVAWALFPWFAFALTLLAVIAQNVALSILIAVIKVLILIAPFVALHFVVVTEKE